MKTAAPAEMTGRERVRQAMHYRRPDKIPVQFYYSPVGYYEHGDKLNDLYAQLPGDFGEYVRIPLPAPEKGDFSPDGRYLAHRLDEWGTLWEYRIFGVTGIPKSYPLADLSALPDYVFPPPPALEGPEFERYRDGVRRHQRRYYYLQYAGSLFERLIALRPEEDVLCEIALDDPDLARLADRIAAYDGALVRLGVAAGADGISFGDDYGTMRGLIMSPGTWRRFIKPRLRAIFAPAVAAGLDIHFHSCGKIGEILEDLREIGVTSVWPQLPAYDMAQLAARCRSLGLAVAVHTDRAVTMTSGTPQQVCELIEREYETFKMADGGSWFYIEADNGFPFANLEAMIRTIKRLR